MTNPHPGAESRSAPDVLLAEARLGKDGGEALGRLFEIYRNYLRLLARAQMRGGLRLQLAPSDLVQETLLEAHRDFGEFHGETEGELLGWLRRILVRNLADQVKLHQAKKRDWKRQQSLEAMLSRSSLAIHRALAATISSPSAQAAKREQAVLVADALAELPEDYRTVLVLRHVERLPFEQIAERMERTSGAVRKLWTRALLKMKTVVDVAM